MTRIEFDDWFDHHCSRFTGVESWLAKFQEIGSGATQRSILDAWYLAVSSLTVAQAKWATDQMFASPAKPRSFDDHPARIVELNRNADGAKAAGPAATPGGAVCGLCDGTGMVEVATDGRFRQTDGMVNPKAYVFVACRCSVGRWMNARRKGSEMPEHDPSWMRLGSEVRAEVSRANLERKGLLGLSFGEQIRRALGKFGAMPREVYDDFDRKRSAADEGLREMAARRAERDAQEAEGLGVVIEGCPF